jgi:hypothetical protein
LIGAFAHSECVFNFAKYGQHRLLILRRQFFLASGDVF